MQAIPTGMTMSHNSSNPMLCDYNLEHGLLSSNAAVEFLVSSGEERTTTIRTFNPVGCLAAYSAISKLDVARRDDIIANVETYKSQPHEKPSRTGAPARNLRASFVQSLS